MRQNLPSIRPRYLLIVVLIGLLVGVSIPTGPLLISGPRLLEATPADQASDVNPQAPLQLVFDQWVNTESLSKAISFNPPVEFTVEHAESPRPWRSVINVVPSGGLRYGQRYTLTLGAGVRNLLGRATAEPQSLAFATSNYLTVAKIAPVERAERVPLHTPITINFGAPVVSPEQVAAAAEDPTLAAQLPGSGQDQPTLLTLDPPVAGVGRWLSPTMYGFYPTERLRAATEYRATLTDAISTDGRAQLERPLTWNFITEAPLLLGTQPFDGASDVPVDSVVEVQLDPDVDVDSAMAHFALADASTGEAVEGTLQPSDSGFLFKPAAPLARSASYTATLAPGIQTRNAKPLNNQSIDWDFTVIGDLEIDQVEPRPDTQQVATDLPRISVRFNHPVVAVTTISQQQQVASFTIDPPIAGVGSWLDTSTYVFSPTERLMAAKDYRVTVAAGLADQTGGVLRDSYEWNFRTAAPRLIKTSPSNGYLQMSPNPVFELYFDQPMNEQDLRDFTHLRNSNTGEEIPGTISFEHIDERDFVYDREADTWRALPIVFKAVFTPTVTLERGGFYQILVDMRARAANGGALEVASGSSYGVAPLPALESIDANIFGLSPFEPGHMPLSFDFSTNMNWSSVWEHLQITPSATDVYTNGFGTTFQLNFATQPETEYRITLLPGARDVYGVTIDTEHSFTFSTTAMRPQVMLAPSRRVGVYSTYTPISAPLQHVNVERVSYQLYQLDPEQVPTLHLNTDDWQEFVPDPARLQREGELELTGERNRYKLTPINLGELAAGVYLLQVESPNGPSDKQLMVVSPYAITLKRSAEQLFVWVVDLGNGKPVADLPLTAVAFSYDDQGRLQPMDEPRLLGRTAADGSLLADFSVSATYAPIYVSSAAGEQFVLASSHWDRGISGWEFDFPMDLSGQVLRGSIVTDRPLYRPEQNVYIRGVFRLDNDLDLQLPAAGQRARLLVDDPFGTTILSTTLDLSEFGTFNTSLPLGSNVLPGYYDMYARLDDSPNGQVVYGQFQVAEYRLPAFEVNVVPSAADLMPGEELKVQATASYYTGGAVADAPVQWRVMASPLWFNPADHASPGWGYSFGDPDDASDWYRGDNPRAEFKLLAMGEGRTDGQGNFTISQAVNLEQSMQGRRLEVEFDITDRDGQSITGATEVLLHPGDAYIGLRSKSYIGQIGQPLDIQVQTIDPQGQAIGPHTFDVQLYKREWFVVREDLGGDGLGYSVSYTDTLVSQSSVTTDARGRADVQVTPTSGGLQRIVVEGRDSAGHLIRSSIFVWVGGEGAFWGVDNSLRMDLIADKREYRPGEQAQILIAAPYPNMSALVTVERGNVLEHRVMQLQGTTELLQLPITKDFAPNVYVSVMLIKSAKGSGDLPDMRMGMVELVVSSEQQQLNVNITPNTTQVGPRDQITYSIEVTDHTGKGVQAEVALALVDKAILALADDSNPTLMQVFYRWRMLGVSTAQSLTEFASRVVLQPEAKGGGGGGGVGGGEDVLARQNFAGTAYWNPSLVTDQNGKASVTVQLPDNLTTWVMRAWAVTPDTLVGQSETEVVASRQLLVRPTLPRFLTMGDQAQLQTVVQNSTNAPINATVRLVLGGDAATLKANGPQSQEVQIPANDTALLRWPVEAVAAGQAVVRFEVTGGGLQDIVEVSLPVQRFLTPEVVASAGLVRSGTPLVETLALEARPGELELVLEPSLAAGMSDGLSVVENKAFDCTEATASAILSNAVSYRLMSQLGDADLKARLEQNLTRDLQQLMLRQNLDGGWSWCASSTSGEPSSPYVSIYAVQSLVEAQRVGFTVAPQRYADALDYLSEALNDELRMPRDTETSMRAASIPNLRSYALFVLAEAGKADRGRAVTLFDQRHRLQVYGKAYLLMTLQTLGGEQQRVDTLIGELMESAFLTTTDAYWREQRIDFWAMSSDDRSTALAVQALVRSDPNNFLIPNAVRHLMGASNVQADAPRLHARTTLEWATILMALAEYLPQTGELDANYSYEAALNGSTLSKGDVNRQNVTTPIRVLVDLATLSGQQSQLQMQRDGEPGRLYYTLRLRYTEPAAQVQALDRGIGVERSYVAVDTATLSPTGELVREALLGDVVQVQLTLTVPEDMPYVMVEDMLPAGLEALDSSLNTTSAAAREDFEQTDSELPGWWFFTHSAVRDNRVSLFAYELPKGTYQYTYLARATTPGSFQALPATAHRMYTPEVFGRSAGAEFTITP